MAAPDHFGWRDRAIALASLGAASLSRLTFAPADPSDPQPLEMQVLVALALQDSLGADPPRRTGIHWIGLALREEQAIVEEIVRRLERANLIRRSSDALAEIEWELGAAADEDLITRELPISLTELGLETIDRWISRTKRHFGGWPPEQSDVDDAVG
jgi:hypothetical protein